MNAQRRDAMLRAMMQELAETGYREASVERARAVAGVSEEEFAEEFDDKDDCLFAAYERLTSQVVTRASAECDASEPWPERVRVGLEALLREMAEQPQMAAALMRAFPGIRPSAYARYVELLSRFEPFMTEGRQHSELEEELPGEVELLAVGAAEAIVFVEVDAGRTERLPQMLPDILFSVLVPFMGPKRAAEEMRTAAMSS